MGFLLQHWDTFIAIATPVLGLVGSLVWKGKREATRREIERWANVAADFVITLIARGVIPAEQEVIVSVWLQRFQYLLGLVGLQVTGRNLDRAKAIALERVGTSVLNRELSKLGDDARQLDAVVDRLLEKMSPTPQRRASDRVGVMP